MIGGQGVTAVAFVIVSTLATGPAAAQSPEPGNAAAHYQRAIDRASAMTVDEKARIDAYQTDPRAEPPAGVRALLARQAPTIADLRRGSLQPYLDWHLDYSAGFELLLPHLGALRGAGRIVRAQVILDYHDGHSADAAEGIATLYRLSAHIGADRILISSLVARAIHASAEQLTDIGFDQGLLQGLAIERLRNGHRALQVGDPFRFRESIAIEHELAMVSINHAFSAADEERAEVISWFAPDEEEAAQLMALDDAQVAVAMDQYDEAMFDVATAFAEPDREEARALLAELSEQIESGALGPLVGLLMPSFDRAYAMMTEAEDVIAARAKQLDRLANGEADPGELVNAAAYYLRAAELVSELPLETLEALRAEDASAQRAELVSAIDADKLEAILDLVREGNATRRCSFAYLRNRSFVYQACPAYVPDLRDLVRLVHARTRRAIAGDEREAALATLDMAYRLVAHISGETTFATARLAHVTLIRTDALAHDADEAGLVTADGHAQLFRAVDGIERGDPFGYLASVTRLRHDVIRGFQIYGLPPEQLESVEAWDADRLALVVCAMEILARLPEGEAHALWPPERTRVDIAGADRLARIPDLFDPEQLAAISPLAVEIRDAVRKPDAHVLDERVWPIPAQLELSTHSARADLRAAVNRHRPRGAEPDDD